MDPSRVGIEAQSRFDKWVERATRPFAVATGRRTDRRASRPLEQAGGLFHPEGFLRQALREVPRGDTNSRP